MNVLYAPILANKHQLREHKDIIIHTLVFTHIKKKKRDDDFITFSLSLHLTFNSKEARKPEDINGKTKKKKKLKIFSVLPCEHNCAYYNKDEGVNSSKNNIKVEYEIIKQKQKKK